MANFDLDDPLGDLLSDGSNDSFFEEPKVTAKRSSLTKTPEKKSVSELFGIEKSDTTTKTPPDSKANWLGLDDPKKPSEKTKQKQSSPKKIEKKISFEDDNILDNLGLDERNETKRDVKSDGHREASRKSSLVDSILKPSITSSEDKNISFDDILKGSKFSRKTDKTPQPSVKAPTKAEFQPLSTGGSQREGRRPHSLQSGFTDILGILSSEPAKETEKEIRRSTPSSPMKRTDAKSSDTRPTSSTVDSETVRTEVLFPAPANREVKTKSTCSIPNWLEGTSSTVETQKSELTLPDQVESKNTMIQQNRDIESVENPPSGDVMPKMDNYILQSLITQQKLTAHDMEYQNSTMAMQQQNSQLIIALELKKYEENLALIQKRQQELLSKQEKQFNSLLERQFAKQQMMENNMRMQQERINNHMQMLLSQSSLHDVPISEDLSKVEEMKKTASEESLRLLEDLLGSVKQKSQEEKFLLEESYKKQISTLEQTMESIENRLKTEIDHVHSSYANKFDQLKDDYREEIQKYKVKIEEMSSIQASEIRSIRESHDKIIEEIKYEYSTLIENIKQTKQSESQLFQNSVEYSQKLDTGIQILDANAKLLVGVREKVDNDYGVLSLAREESLKAKEEEIKLMRQSLEKVRASTETERSQLLSLVRSLEVKLSEQTQAAREERWTMQQAAATLAARSAALDREAEFNRASIEREREQLKTLKETLLAEQEAKALQLTEEKLSLSAERSRLETSTKLNQNYDAQRARAEIEAAIEVAQKAAELTDAERRNLQRAQCEVETLKRTLQDREHKVAMREKELESLMQIAEKKSRDGEQAIVRANATQRDYNERLKDIQNQLVCLTNREKKLAEEKVSLSKERIGLQTQMRQLKHSTLRVFEPASHQFDEDFPESI